MNKLTQSAIMGAIIFLLLLLGTGNAVAQKTTGLTFTTGWTAHEKQLLDSIRAINARTLAKLDSNKANGFITPDWFYKHGAAGTFDPAYLLDSLAWHNSRINTNRQLEKDSIAAHNIRINANRQLAKDSIAAHNTKILTLQDSIKALRAAISFFSGGTSNIDTLALHAQKFQQLLDSIAVHNSRININRQLEKDSTLAQGTRINTNRQAANDSIAAHNGRININKQLASDSIAARLAWSKQDRDSIKAHNDRINLAKQLTADSVAAHNQRMNVLKDSVNAAQSLLAKDFMGEAYLRSGGDSVSVTIPNVRFGVASWSTTSFHVGSLYIVPRNTFFTIFSNGDESIDSLKVNYRVQK